ncbi:MAG: glycosyltransferase family 2 protein [Geobacteraceae bacterium]|nr:glycosyltransferase family 2 protein [Geobacteraceae bacterium]NTW79522.1 glycosyltransferase family 2 protein [Geobacteraceae bacterium]
MSKQTTVTVIVPCRNETEFINTFVLSVLSQNLDNIRLEIIIADGMSNDGTREKLNNILAKHNQLRVIDNPERTTPSALNHGIRAAQGSIIVRMDVHTEYATDYINQCVDVLQQTGADNVGGAWHANGSGYLQKAIALAFQSPFSSGGAGSHSLSYEGEVDSVYLGCWRKSIFDKVGYFDEELVRNQDDELNLRIKRAGGKIWQSPLIQSRYYPRASLKALFKQYMQYGYWKVRVIQKHKLPASFRHVVPGSFVACLIFLGMMSFFYKPAQLALFSLLCVYLLGTSIATIMACRRLETLRYAAVMPLVFAAYHFGYGYGFLRGAIDFIVFRKFGQKQFVEITRG